MPQSSLPADDFASDYSYCGMFRCYDDGLEIRYGFSKEKPLDPAIWRRLMVISPESGETISLNRTQIDSGISPHVYYSKNDIAWVAYTGFVEDVKYGPRNQYGSGDIEIKLKNEWKGESHVFIGDKDGNIRQINIKR